MEEALTSFNNTFCWHLSYRISDAEGLGGALDSAFLIRSQVMLMLLAIVAIKVNFAQVVMGKQSYRIKELGPQNPLYRVQFESDS